MTSLKNRKFALSMALLLGVLVSSPLVAMEHGSGGGRTLEGPMDEMGAGQIMIGLEAESGVRAMFHLLPLDSGKKNGATHHLMVKLVDLSSGRTITDAKVTVNAIPPSETGKKSGYVHQYVVPVESVFPEGEAATPPGMETMEDHFGTDVTLDQPGLWQFEIEAKLEDGRERTFDAYYKLK